jgi:NTP pyrophosphatase (non-canonical NTP hydrolase)
MRKVSRGDMSFNEYQTRTSWTAVYPPEKALEYLALGLVSEAGEVAGKAKKIIRDHGSVISPEMVEAMKAEIGDVLWYAAQLCTVLQMNMSSVANANLEKLAKRKQDGTLKGSGDNR